MAPIKYNSKYKKVEENGKSYYCLICKKRHLKTSDVGKYHYGRRWRPCDEFIVAKLRASAQDNKMLFSHAVRLVGESTVKRLSKAGPRYGVMWFFIVSTRGGKYLQF